MNPGRLMSGLMFALIIFFSGMFVWGGYANEDAYDIDSDNTSFENLTKLMTKVFNDTISMKEDITAEKISSDSAWENVIGGSYNTVSKIWKFFTYSGQILSSVILAFGIPEPIMYGFTALLTIGMVLSLVFMFFRFEPS